MRRGEKETIGERGLMIDEKTLKHLYALTLTRPPIRLKVSTPFFLVLSPLEFSRRLGISGK
jgi:hypothetical protein